MGVLVHQGLSSNCFEVSGYAITIMVVLPPPSVVQIMIRSGRPRGWCTEEKGARGFINYSLTAARLMKESRDSATVQSLVKWETGKD